MKIDIIPSNIRTVKIRVRKRGQYFHANLTFPKDIIDRYDIKDGESVVICYFCKADENFEFSQKEEK